MKRHLVFFVVMLIVVAFSSAVWAGERSNLLSKKELNVIESIAHKAYPKGAKVSMVVGNDLFDRYTVIEFFKEDDTLSLRLEVYPHWARMSDAESTEIGERVGVKLIEEIEKILNENPRTALGNIIK